MAPAKPQMQPCPLEDDGNPLHPGYAVQPIIAEIDLGNGVQRPVLFEAWFEQKQVARAEPAEACGAAEDRIGLLRAGDQCDRDLAEEAQAYPA